MSAGKVEVAIIGGGLSGAAAAIRLAQAGCETVLIEKEAKPQHKVCGEFLSFEALSYLASLGVDIARLGGVSVSTVRVCGNLGVSESPLPFRAMSLTRKALDEELLRLAGDAGVGLLRGAGVRSLERDGRGWKLWLADRSVVEASSVFLATGKHDLHGLPRPAGVQSDLIAFKMYWRLAAEQAAALAEHVELNLYRGGYAGLQPVEDGVANLCCLVRRTQLQRVGGRWEGLLAAMRKDCAHLHQRLCGAESLLERPLAVSAIPYGFVRRHAEGVWALGDQAAVIPSFTGDGMSIALHSGLLAAQMYVRGATAEEFQERLHNELTAQVSLATTLSRGLVREPQRTLMEAAVRLWPGVLQIVAKRTRLAV